MTGDPSSTPPPAILSPLLSLQSVLNTTTSNFTANPRLYAAIIYLLVSCKRIRILPGPTCVPACPSPPSSQWDLSLKHQTAMTSLMILERLLLSLRSSETSLQQPIPLPSRCNPMAGLVPVPSPAPGPIPCPLGVCGFFGALVSNVASPFLPVAGDHSVWPSAAATTLPVAWLRRAKEDHILYV